MKKSAKMGFTLVELLVTIILLGVIGAIVVYNMMNVSTNSKDAEYEKFVAKVKSAAEAYANLNPDVFKDLYINKAYLYIKMEDLINDGKIDEKLVNPYTEERVKPDELIKANLSTSNGALTFEYPVKSNTEESFLVALSDYVVNGEPYDCMQGAGTYQLALSEENGDLIMLDSQETIDKYNFKCEYPSEFKSYGSDSPASFRNGKYTKTAGTYDITYSWVTESGIKKSTKRTLRVLSEVIPTFSIKEVVNGNSSVYNYNFDENPYYTPSYTKENGWKYLTYTPLIEGSDPENTKYTVKKIALNQFSDIKDPNKAIAAEGAKEELVVADSNDFSTAYPVDDGPKLYTIDTVVHGHYNKEYSYEAHNSVIMRSKLIIPDEFISVNSSNWATNRTITIKAGIHSPVGTAYYEYSLVKPQDTSSKYVESKYTFNDRYSSSASVNVPLRSNNNIIVDVNRPISIFEGNSCIDSRVEYTNIYVRAINDDGYLGDWKEVNVKLTSDLSKLIIQDTHCIKTSTNSCYFTNKNAYIDYNGTRFVVLEKYSDNSFLVTLDGVGKNATPIRSYPGQIRVDNCDVISTASITYRSPIIENIFSAVNLNLPHMDKHGLATNWHITSQYVYAYRYNTKHGVSQEYRVATRANNFSAIYGNPSEAQVKKYGSAMATGRNYWTTDMFNRQATVTATDSGGGHRTTGTYFNVYIKYVDVNGGVNAGYIGDTMPVKPMLVLHDLNICETSGVDGNITYKVALGS